jgi:hypothetical protein
MRGRQKIVMSAVAALVPLAGWFAFVPAAAAGVTPYDNSMDTVVCQTVSKGVIKPKPLLVNGGSLPAVLSVSGTLGGCSSPSNANLVFPEGKSKFKGTINSATNNCLGLLGPTTGTGTLTITWSATEMTTGATLLHKTSTVSIPTGGAIGNFASEGPGLPGGLYGTFVLGAPNGAGPLAVSGGFQGTDAGATSTASIITQESVPTLTSFCAAKGIKQVTLGVTSIELQ